MTPVVSIGMPAFNEATHVEEAIGSLLAQTYRSFELIISDNASADETYEIVLDYAARDDRIRPFRNGNNIGAIANFMTVRDLACGEYFMWAGAHDRWDASFISRLLPVLEGDPRVVLAYSQAMRIDNEGRELGVGSEHIDTRGLAAVDRYKKLVLEIHNCNMFHGLIRRQAMIDLAIRPVWGSDVLLLAELSLRGSFAQVPNVLFYRREVREEVDGSDKYRRRLWTALDPVQAERKSKLTTTAMARELRNKLIVLALKSPQLNNIDRLRAAYAVLARYRYVSPIAGKLAFLAVQITRAFRGLLAGRSVHGGGC